MEAGRTEVNVSLTLCYGSNESSASRHRGSERKVNISEEAGKVYKESYQTVTDDKLNNAEFPYPLEVNNLKDNEDKDGVEVNIRKKERFEIKQEVAWVIDKEVVIEGVTSGVTEGEDEFTPSRDTATTSSGIRDDAADPIKMETVGDLVMLDKADTEILEETRRYEQGRSKEALDPKNYDGAAGKGGGRYNQEELRLTEAYMKLDKDKDDMT